MPRNNVVTVEDQYGHVFPGYFKRRTRRLCYVETDTNDICDSFGELEMVEVNVRYYFEGRFKIVRTGETETDDDSSSESTESTSSDSTDSDYREYLTGHWSSGDDDDDDDGSEDEQSKVTKIGP